MKPKTNDIERRYTSIPVGYKDDGETRKIGGYAAVFNKLSEDLGGFREKIDPRAFDDVLDNDVRAYFNHDRNKILARVKSGTLSIGVDEKGLHYELIPGNQTYSKDLQESMDRGDVDQSSFAFIVLDDHWEESDEHGYIRTVLKAKRLFDVSPVSEPAYPDATVGLRRLEQFKESRNQPEPEPEVDPDDDKAKRAEFIKDWSDEWKRINDVREDESNKQ